MAEQEKSDAMKAAEAKGMQTSQQGGRAEQERLKQQQAAQQQQQARRQAENPPRAGESEEAASTVPGSQVGQNANTGPDRVTASRSRDIASAQGLSFSGLTLYDLQNIYANLRDGNYYSAFRSSLSLLNSLFNPDVSGPTPGRNIVRAGAMRPAMAGPHPFHAEGTKAFNDCCDAIEQWCEQAEGNQQLMGATAERNVPAGFNPDMLVTILRMVLQLIDSFRTKE